ncbi:ankyrin repeat protein, partial [Neocallimastix californiae]
MLQQDDILIDEIDGMGKTGLILACENDHLEVVNLLLDSHCNLFIRDNSGRSAIFFACETNNTEMIKLLLHHQADITQNDNDNVYPLHLVSAKGNLEIVRVFVEDQQADIECRDNFGYTPLFLAYIHHQNPIIKYL